MCTSLSDDNSMRHTTVVKLLRYDMDQYCNCRYDCLNIGTH